MSSMISAIRRSGAALLALGLAASSGACGSSSGDDDGHGANSLALDTNALACPSDSLTITSETFPAGTTVTFVMGSTMYDGSAVVLPDHGDGPSIDCGFPTGAMPGDYDVIVTKPGQPPETAGTVTLDRSTCS